MHVLVTKILTYSSIILDHKGIPFIGMGLLNSKSKDVLYGKVQWSPTYQWKGPGNPPSSMTSAPEQGRGAEELAD